MLSTPGQCNCGVRYYADSGVANPDAIRGCAQIEINVRVRVSDKTAHRYFAAAAFAGQTFDGRVVSVQKNDSVAVRKPVWRGRIVHVCILKHNPAVDKRVGERPV